MAFADVRHWIAARSDLLADVLRDTRPSLWRARISIFALIIGATMLLVPEQINNLVAGLSWQRTIFFGLAAAAWSFTLWFWARWAVTLDFGRPEADNGLDWGVRWIPKSLAFLGAGAAYAAAANGTGPLSWQSLVVVGVALFVYFVSHQHRGQRALRGEEAFLTESIQLGKQFGGCNPDGGIRAPTRKDGNDDRRKLWDAFYAGAGWNWFLRLWRDLAAAPAGRIGALVLILAALLVVGLFTFIPHIVGPRIGAPAAALIGLAASTTLFSVLILSLGRHTGLPVLPLMLIGAAASDRYLDVGNHDIRVLDGRVLPDERPDLKQAAEAWIRNCMDPNPQHPAKVVLVATAGGASRAALWTTTVLNALNEADPEFHRKVFAISGVSGGSLGAALWTAMLADTGDYCNSGPVDVHELTKRRVRTRFFMEQDFLAAPIGSMMTVDPLWRHLLGLNLLPMIPAKIGEWLSVSRGTWVAPTTTGGVPIPTGLIQRGVSALRTSWTPPDRAAAIERSWEAQWDLLGKKPNRFAEGFHDLYRDGATGAWDWRLPLLLLNGTHQDTGLPLVTAPARLVVRGVTTPPPAVPSIAPPGPAKERADDVLFPAAHDLLGHVDREIRLSTAVTNSARFPYITPGGGLRTGQPSAQVEKNYPAGMRIGNVVDGGYFDNQGAGTLSDAALVFYKAFRTVYPDTDKAPGRKLDLMVVQITSDPDRRIGELMRCKSELRPEVWPEDETLRRFQLTQALLRGGSQPSGLDAATTPLAAIAATQSAHTVRSSVNLARVFCGNSEAVKPPPNVTFELVHLMLCKQSADQTIDLNWVLPTRTADYITPYVNIPGYRGAMDACRNEEEIQRFRTWLDGNPATQPALPPPKSVLSGR
jgi:hypothetical protein